MGRSSRSPWWGGPSVVTGVLVNDSRRQEGQTQSDERWGTLSPPGLDLKVEEGSTSQGCRRLWWTDKAEQGLSL